MNTKIAIRRAVIIAVASTLCSTNLASRVESGEFDILARRATGHYLQQPFTFASALKNLSRQGKTLIIAEGASAPANDRNGIVDILNSNQPFAHKLNRFAELYDYSIESNQGTYILTKKYTSESELPCITLQELEATANDIVRATNVIAPYLAKTSPRRDPSADGIHDFLRTLTPDQWRLLQSQGLLVEGLSSQQHDKVSSLFASGYASLTRSTALDVSYMTKKAGTAHLVIGSVRPGMARRFGMRYPYTGNRELFYPLGAPRTDRPDASIVKNVTKEQMATWAEAEDIGALVARLNRRGQNDGVTFAVAPMLKDKPITVGGEEYTPPVRIARAVAVLYGLKLERRAAGQMLLRRNGLPAKITPASLRDALLQIFPRPLRNAMAASEADQWDGRSVPSRPSMMRRRIPWRTQVIAATARRWLLTAQAEATEKAGNKGVRVSSLPARDKAALGLALSGQFLQAVASRLQGRVPIHITEPQKLLLTAGRYKAWDGSTRLEFDARYWDPVSSRWQQTIGWGYVPNIKLPHEPK